jgi:hypothetical protein
MKTIGLTKKFVATIVALILASTALGSLLTRMYFPQTGTIIVAGPEDPLEAWSEASYILWQYNSTFYACRNMSTLMVMCLLNNQTLVEQYALGNMTSGQLYLKELAHNSSLTLTATQNIFEQYQGVFKYWNSTGSYLFGQPGATGPAGPVTGLSYSYVVFNNATSNYMVNCTTGQIDLQSTNASQIFLAVDGNLSASGGGSYFVKKGLYPIDTQITVSNLVTLVGEGMNTTILQGTSSLTGAVVKVLGTGDGKLHYGGVRDLAIDGSLVTSGSGGQYGLHLYKCQRAQFYNVMVSGTWDSGVFIEGTGIVNDESVLNVFYSLSVFYCGNGQDSIHSGSGTAPAGVELSNWTPDNVFVDANVGANYRCGFYMYSSGNRHLISCHIWGSATRPGTYGIYLTVTQRDKIEACEIEHMGRDGIRVYGGSYNSSTSGGCVITGCTINGNSYGAAGTYDGIFLYADAIDCEGVTIVGNRIWDRASVGNKTQRYGVNLHEVYNATEGKGYIDNLVLVGNDFGDEYSGSSTGPIACLTNMNGTGAEIHHNAGLTLENQGVTYSVINGTWVLHGVDISPNVILLTLRTMTYINSTCYLIQPSVCNSNSTHFQIAFNIYNNGTITPVATVDSRTIYWYAAWQRQPNT